MPKKFRALTAKLCANAKSADQMTGEPKPSGGTYDGHETIYLVDGLGLKLRIRPGGSKYWLYTYKSAGKLHNIGIGAYPLLTLEDAREVHAKLYAERAKGVDIIAAKAERKRKETAPQPGCDRTFGTIANRWLGEKERSGKWTGTTAPRTRTTVESYLISPWGDYHIDDITPALAADLLQNIAANGLPNRGRGKPAPTMAAHLKSMICRIMEYAAPHCKTEYLWAKKLKCIAERPATNVHAALNLEQLRQLDSCIDGYGSRQTAIALRLLMRTALRANELLGSLWTDIDWEAAVLSIPRRRMKIKKVKGKNDQAPHVVPLSRQALELLREQRSQVNSAFIFPKFRRFDSPAVKDARPYLRGESLARCVRDIGWANRVTPHGLRHAFSTIMHDKGFRSEAIEAQLAHTDPNVIRGIYNHAEFLTERRQMMQAFSDLIEFGEIQPDRKILQFAREGQSVS